MKRYIKSSVTIQYRGRVPNYIQNNQYINDFISEVKLELEPVNCVIVIDKLHKGRVRIGDQNLEISIHPYLASATYKEDLEFIKSKYKYFQELAEIVPGYMRSLDYKTGLGFDFLITR